MEYIYTLVLGVVVLGASLCWFVFAAGTRHWGRGPATVVLSQLEGQ